MGASYHDFDPWRQAAYNLSAGMVAVNRAKNARAMQEAEMAQRQPLVDAQTAKYNADAEATSFETKRGRDMEGQLGNLAQVIAAGTMRNEDGSVTRSQQAESALAQALVMVNKGSADLGMGVERTTKAGNYNFQQEQNRVNAKGMNDADNTAAMDRAKLPKPAATSTPEATSIRLRQLAKQADRIQNALFEARNVDSSDAARAEDKITLQRELKKVNAEIERISGGSQNSQNSQLTPAPVSGQGVNTPAGKRPLDVETAKALLVEAGGDKAKARQLALERGYEF